MLQVMSAETIEPWAPEANATVITLASEADTEIVGTARSENWCRSTSPSSSSPGVTENLHAKRNSTGGSTSGGASLVGAGLVDFAIGVD
jgi:amidase